ncbi:MAG TPA: hypothetical protein VIL46_01840, partial [Gemmataceae bacterium]
TVLNHYILEHSWRWLSDPGYVGSLWTAPFFHPEPWTLAFSENLFAVAPVYWLLRCGLDPVTAYQTWMMVLAALDFAAMAVVLRWFGVRHLLCVLGAYLFAFSLPAINQIVHQQLLARMFAPFAVYYGWAFLQTPSNRALGRLVLWWVLQVWAGIYLSWFLTLALAVLALACLGLVPGSWGRLKEYAGANRRTVGKLALAAVLGTAPVLVPYMVGNFGIGWSYEMAEAMLPRPESWLTSPPEGVWHEALKPIAADPAHERWLFAGFGLLLTVALAGVFLARPGGEGGTPAYRLTACFLMTALVLVLITMQWADGWSAWKPIFYCVPGARAIRAVARIFLIVYLFALIGGLVGVQALAESRLRRPALRSVLYAALACFAIGEQLGTEPQSIPVSAVYPRAEELAARVRASGAGAAYFVPTPGRSLYEEEVAAMWAGLRANVPVVNGYSGRYPLTYPNTFEQRPVEAVREWLTSHGWRGRVAILWPDGREETVTIGP